MNGVGGAFKRTRADQMVSVPLTNREDDRITMFYVFMIPRRLGDVVDDFCEGTIAEDMTLGVKFKEEVPHNSCEYDIVCSIAGGPGFSSNYLPIGTNSFRLPM